VNKPYSFKKKTTSFTDPQIPYYFVLWSHKATLKMPRRQLQKKFCGQVDKDAFGWNETIQPNASLSTWPQNFFCSCRLGILSVAL